MATLLWTLKAWLRPSIDAIFGRNIPFALRWRMLLFVQPSAFITHSIGSLPWLFSRAFTSEFITLDTGRTVRVIVFKAKSKAGDTKLRPLHLDVHGGAFIGGLPEYDACFCDLLARTTGAVVISASYRFAPAHRFPAAIDDIDSVVRFLQAHARERWGADPELMTVSGSSAGGNLVLASTQQPACQLPSPMAYRAAVLFQAAIEMRLKPEEKPKPLNAKGEDRMPKVDPSAPLFPLFDSYPELARKDHIDDPRLSPMLAKLETLPNDLLLIIPAIDILVHEELTFAERIKAEIAADPHGKGEGRSCEAVIYDKGFHGWTELPSFISGPSRMEAINRGVNFLRDVYEKFGWKWSA